MTHSLAPMMILFVAMVILLGLAMRWLDVTFESRMAKYWIIGLMIFITVVSVKYGTNTLLLTLTALFGLAVFVAGIVVAVMEWIMDMKSVSASGGKKKPTTPFLSARKNYTVASVHEQQSSAHTIFRSKRSNFMQIGGILTMMIYGLFLPVNWQTQFGSFAKPMIWAAEAFPAINKVARFSTIPELIQGFYGLSVYVIPLFGLLMYVCVDSDKKHIRFDRFYRPFWKNFCVTYLVLYPVIIFMFYMCYINPYIPDTLLMKPVTWGEKIVFNILHSRYYLSFYGSIMTVAMGMLFCVFIALVVGPILTLRNRGE